MIKTANAPSFGAHDGPYTEVSVGTALTQLLFDRLAYADDVLIFEFDERDQTCRIMTRSCESSSRDYVFIGNVGEMRPLAIATVLWLVHCNDGDMTQYPVRVHEAMRRTLATLTSELDVHEQLREYYAPVQCGYAALNWMPAAGFGRDFPTADLRDIIQMIADKEIATRDLYDLLYS